MNKEDYNKTMMELHEIKARLRELDAREVSLGVRIADGFDGLARSVGIFVIVAAIIYVPMYFMGWVPSHLSGS